MKRAGTMVAGLGLAFAGVIGCSGHAKTVARVDDSGLSRLDDSQLEPVDNARVDEGRARDALSRATANLAEAKSRLEVAKSERDVAEAQLKRSLAERDMLKKQYADRDSIARVEQDINGSQQRIHAADLKREYLTRMITVAEAERDLAASHVETTAALTEQAKVKAMRAANAPQLQDVNTGAIDGRVAEAQVHEAQLRKIAADKRTEAIDVYNRWQETDAKVRTLARPDSIPVPPPTVGEPGR